MMRFNTLLRMVLLGLLLTLTSSFVAANDGGGDTGSERPPNIVLYIADDMGYGDASCYGNKRFDTPNIDALARNGMRFTDFYSNGAVCSPTRAALMTGRFQQRSGIDGVITAANHRDWGLHADEVTFARQLHKAGYATALFGKWHLGYEKRFNPIHHGFDEFRGFVSGNIDYFSHYDQTGRYDWWANDRLVEEDGYVTHLITEHAVRFIRDNKEKPFLLVLAHEAPHYPYQGPRDRGHRARDNPGKITGERTDRREAYQEMLVELDKSVGQTVAELYARGLADKTLIIFISDNGGASLARNEPLRGRKGHLFEGGIRVPAIFAWQGRIEPGSMSNEQLTTLDIMPTLLELADVTPGSGHRLDGQSMLPILLNGQTLGERPLFWMHRPNDPNRSTSTAMRLGDWKLLLPSENEAPQLFNLRQDLGETKDLAAHNPVRVRSMMQSLHAWRADVQSNTTPQPPPR